jgi:hypothetical protein
MWGLLKNLMLNFEIYKFDKECSKNISEVFVLFDLVIVNHNNMNNMTATSSANLKLLK